MNQLVSVIIPVYNHAAVIEKSCQSLLSQTYRPIEVIVVNDGSTDNFASKTSKIVNLLRANGVETKIITQPNKGAAAARNRGAQESKGEYLLFWDADTLAKPVLLAKMHGVLRDDREASFAYSQFRFGWKKMKSQAFSVTALRKYNYIDTTSLIRRAVFTGFDESLHRFQDWDLWLTLIEKNKTGIFIPEVLFKKVVGFRKGYSSWLPRFWYKLPWKSKKVRGYEQAKEVIQAKHKLLAQATLRP